MPPTGQRVRATATLKSVAEAANVHPSTVSRALDPARRHMIAAEVVARVQAVARNLGYRPDPVAASLRTRRTHLVGVLVPDIANPVFSPIISGISEAVAEKGYSTIVADVGTDPQRQTEIVAELAARRVDGLVLATVRRDDPVLRYCLEGGVPVVLVNRADEADRVSSVVSDDRHGMALAVDHLVGLGHGRIGHVAGPDHISTGALRREGFVAAMQAHGLDASAVIAASAYDRAPGEAAAGALLAAHPGLTAIVAANDLLALGAIAAVRALGRRCPQDVSIVGHNDMPLIDLVDPPLTTIRIGPRDMGRDAAALLLERMAREDAPVRRVVLRPALIARRSTAPPPAAPS